jgi:hypothetical protein
LPLPIVILDAVSTSLPNLLVFVPPVLTLLSSPIGKALYVVGRDGRVVVPGGRHGGGNV